MSAPYESETQRMLREVRDRDRLLKNASIAKELLAHRSSVAEIQEALRVTKVLREPGFGEGMRLARMAAEATRHLAGTDLGGAAAAQEALGAARTFPQMIDAAATTDQLRRTMDATSAMITAKPRLQPAPAIASGPRAERVDGAASIGPLVRKARKAMKLSQAEFAAHAGVGRRFLSELEGGKSSLEFDKVVACAQAAGIDLFARPRHG